MGNIKVAENRIPEEVSLTNLGKLDKIRLGEEIKEKLRKEDKI